MGNFEKEHLDKIKRGILLFNAQKYWECHEDLEDHWLEEPGPVRNVYWAVIQVAAAMIHYRDSNLVGARGLIYKAKQKFKKCEELHVESSLLNDALTWESFKKMVMTVPDQPELEDFKDLYNYRFKDPMQWT